MNQHDDDKGMMDKVKDAIGMGDDDEHRDEADREHTTTGARREGTRTDDLAGSENRPGGPDYGATHGTEERRGTEERTAGGWGSESGHRDPDRRNEGL